MGVVETNVNEGGCASGRFQLPEDTALPAG